VSGWSKQKRQTAEKAFYAFLSRCYINSKDYGRVCLGESLYWGQRYAITEIFNALENDIHDIYILKSRQLGISTLVRALMIFFEGMFPGLKGAIVFDTDQNKQESRAELEVMINDLPKSLRFPKIKTNNRVGLTLYNESKVLFMSAGVRKSKSSGTLGRSVGLALATLSELCSYDNDEGLEAFEQSLSDANPDRLYIRESTARGYNHWWEMWEEARRDPLHRKCIFLGWWSKESQRITCDAIDFDMYGKAPPTSREIDKIQSVKKFYGYDVDVEQLAWIRRKMDPTADAGEDSGPDYEGSPIRIQEQPWTESEAFQQTGSVFFPQEKLTELTREHVSNKYKGYMFWAGAEFTDMRVYPAENMRMTELKVWEEPDPDGSYVMAVDPAFGENEENDRSSIQILRCYADGVDQVAEYAWPLVTTYQLAWVVASLLGWYGQARAEVRYILELNGPGTAVFNELKNLRMKIDAARHQPIVQDKGLADIFRNVRTYIYTRPDSMGAGYNWHWVTNIGRKVTVMERLRDFVANNKLHVRSLAAIDEMKTIAREGDSIKAPGKMKDDRVFALALAVHYWEAKIMQGLIAQKKTREAEAARRQLSIVDQVQLFNQNHLEDFFKTKKVGRLNLQAQMMRNNWRYGGRRY
jgi:hypothetical protein